MTRTLNSTFTKLISKYVDFYHMPYNEALEATQFAIERIELVYVVGLFENELYDIDYILSKEVDEHQGKVFKSLTHAKIFQIRRALKLNSFTISYVEELETELNELLENHPEYAL